MTRLQGTQHAIHVQRSTWHRDTMHGQVFLFSNDHTASTKSDSNNTSGQSRLSLVAPVIHRTPELEQGSGVVVPLVLARHAHPNSNKEAASWSLLFLSVMRSTWHKNTMTQTLRTRKKWKLIFILLTTETNTKLEQWWYSTEEKLEQWWYSTEEKLEQWWYSTEEKLEQWWYSTQDETRAMVVLNTGRNSSNGGTQQNGAER